MSMEIDQPEAVTGEVAGGLRSEPGGRAQRPAGGAPTRELPREVWDRLSDEVIDGLLAGARTEEEIVGPGGLLADLTRRLVERALDAELTEHLGYEPHRSRLAGPGTRATGPPKRRLRPSTGRFGSRRHGTVTAVL